MFHCGLNQVAGFLVYKGWKCSDCFVPRAWDFWENPKTFPLRDVCESLAVCLFLKVQGGLQVAPRPPKKRLGLWEKGVGGTPVSSLFSFFYKRSQLTYFQSAQQNTVFSCWMCYNICSFKTTLWGGLQRSRLIQRLRNLPSMMHLQSRKAGSERI